MFLSPAALWLAGDVWPHPAGVWEHQQSCCWFSHALSDSERNIWRRNKAALRNIHVWFDPSWVYKTSSEQQESWRDSQHCCCCSSQSQVSLGFYFICQQRCFVCLFWVIDVLVKYQYNRSELIITLFISLIQPLIMSILLLICKLVLCY